MGRHEAPASVATFDAVVSDYVTGRARELTRQFDQISAQPAELTAGYNWAEWIGAAAEILRELTRDE